MIKSRFKVKMISVISNNARYPYPYPYSLSSSQNQVNHSIHILPNIYEDNSYDFWMIYYTCTVFDLWLSKTSIKPYVMSRRIPIPSVTTPWKGFIYWKTAQSSLFLYVLCTVGRGDFLKFSTTTDQSPSFLNEKKIIYRLKICSTVNLSHYVRAPFFLGLSTYKF